MQTADGQLTNIVLADIVRAYPANQLSFLQKLRGLSVALGRVSVRRSAEHQQRRGRLSGHLGHGGHDADHVAAVVPFGVLAALYLREYAKAGPIVSAVRIAINNLAGVPSIVFGVFGLGFFCYVVGAKIDQLFFRAALADSSRPSARAACCGPR